MKMNELRAAEETVQAALVPGSELTPDAQCAAWTLAKAWLRGNEVVAALRQRCEEADKLVGQLREACIQVLVRWRFDNGQQHTHNWHDMADCKAVIFPLLTEEQQHEIRFGPRRHAERRTTP